MESAAMLRLHELVSRLVACPDLGALLEEVLDASVEITGAAMGNIRLYDPRTGLLTIAAQRGFPPDYLSRSTQVSCEASDAHSCSRAAATRTRIVVPDLRLEAGDASADDTLLASGARALQATPLVGRSGELLGVLSTHRRTPGAPSETALRLLDFYAQQTADAIERARSAQALQASEARYRQLFESIDEGFCVIEVLFDRDRPVDYRFLEVNRVFEEQTGIRDAVGRRIREIAPAHEQYWFDIYGRVATTGEPMRFQRPAHALARFYDVYAFRVDAPEQRRVAVLFSDISERRRAEQALRESEERFRVLVESAAQAVWETDADGRVVVDSPSWRACTGQSVEQCRGLGWLDAIDPAHRAAVQRQWQDAVAAGDGVDGEYRVRCADGGWRWTNVHAAPIRDETGRILRYVGMNLDISERKRAEQALRDADRRKDAFLGTLAHELRNPLAPLRSALEIMRRAPDDADAVGRARAIMDRQLRHMVRLIDDLLDVSRVNLGRIRLQRASVDLVDAVRGALETVRPLFEAGGRSLDVELPAEPVRVDGDATRLCQVVTNLLHNAAKYTRRGGRATLTLTCEGDTAVLSVHDDGMGIPPHMLSAVFEMFAQVDRTLDRAHGGLGIGLALVRQLVAMHGGSITAHSEGADRGSRFVVRLPLSMAAAGTAARPQAPMAQASPRRVLVVDDNVEGAATLSALLELMGNQVRTAASGLAALAIAAEFRPDVVLLDIGMPGIDGYETARRLRAQPRGEQVSLVALTGWGQPQDRQRAREAGFDEHLVKPAEPEAIECVLARLPRRRPDPEPDDATAAVEPAPIT